jgi:membrane fusion protein
MRATARPLCVSPQQQRTSLPADSGLFRSEVLAERQTQWLGTVLLTPRISHAAFTAFSVLLAAAVLALLFFAEYTRKARVNGWLVPQPGLVQLFTPQPGVVMKLYVEEGAEVRAGSRLLLLSTELQSEALGATRTEIVRRLNDRRESLIAGRERQLKFFEQQGKEMSTRLAVMQAEQKHLDDEIGFQRARLALAEKNAARQRQLRQQNLITEMRLEAAEEDRLDQASKLQALERERGTVEREGLRLDAELRELPFQNQTQVAEIDRNIATLEQELAEAEAQRQIVITAPRDGTVTAIQAEPGSSLNVSVPLLSIIPADAKLQAQLFSPSRTIGFVHPGQRVLLRYQAFPYQKFGYYEGTVAKVSRTAVSPAEFTQQVAGLTSLYGGNEPVYRIVVTLAQQTATAYGKAVPLQPGMQLEADLLIGTRRLIEWALDPLFTLTGTWHR